MNLHEFLRSVRRDDGQRRRRRSFGGANYAEICEPRILLSGDEATLLVTTLVDENDSGLGLGDGNSLREVLNAANANADRDVIEFDAALFPGGVRTIELLHGELEIYSEVRLIGPGRDALWIDANENSRVMSVSTSADVEVSGLTLTGGNSNRGGGIWNGAPLTLTDVRLHNNSGEIGGGLYSDNYLVSITDSLIDLNSSRDIGGGIYIVGRGSSRLRMINSTVDGNTARDVSGISVNHGPSEIINSTISNNTISFFAGSGGAISTGAELLIVNTTISGNQGGSTASGLYVHSSTGAAVTVINSTIVNNTVDYNGGGIYNGNERPGALTLHNTIVAGNGTLDGSTFTPQDIRSSYSLAGSSSHNIIGDAGNSGGLVDGTDGNIVGVGGSGIIDINTVIGGLGDHGGTEATHVTVAGSPAINAGMVAVVPRDVNDFDQDGDTTEPIPFDQRGTGFSRVSGASVDIGATEFQESADDSNHVSLNGRVYDTSEAQGTQITITATANRAVDGDQTVDVVVTGDGVTASDYALSNVQITIPDGQTTGAIVFTVLDDGDIETVETATVSIANPSAGIVLGATTANTVSIVSDDVATLMVALDKAAISEDGDTATATVSRNGSNSGALVVNIGSNDRSEIAFPETVTIPDGDSSVTFTVTGLSDTLLDGTRAASVVATSGGFVQGITHIDVLDTDVPELTVELSASTITEAGSVQVTVIRIRGGDGALGMIIVADSTEVSYPETVEIVNNTDRVTFTIHGLADGLVDGTQAIEISASHPGYVSIPTTLYVTDLDTAQLSLSFDPGTVSENGGTTTGTVTRNTDTSEAVSVTIGLSSSDATADATVVEIPAGQSSATFAVTGVDDAISNGSRDVTVTANATGFAGAAADITVADDDAVGIVSIVAIEDANEFDTVNGEFIIEMTTASSVDTIVNINVSGTAVADADYTALPSSVTIPAGLLSATLTVPVINDTDSEDEETVIISLGTITGSGATVDPDQNFDTISIADNDRDLITPTATVRTLPLSTNTSTFTVTIDLDDPASPNGQPVSGVASYDLFVAVDGGDFTLFADDVPASQATVQFTPDSNHRYWFKAVATDNAGNVEDSSPAAETNTYVGDVTAPETSVTSATPNAATGEITLNITGTDAGNSGLDRFLVYVSIDGAAAEEIPASSVSSGTSANGTYFQSVTFQALRDGAAHSYRFYTVGIDGAGNTEAAPTAAAADIQLTETFAAPAGGLDANGIDLQNGETQRSYVRYVDVLFNDVTGLQDLIDNNGIQVERFDLDDNTPTAGTGSLVSPTAAATNGNAIKLDFGSTGLGGSGRAGNGFYRIAIDLDGDGLFDDAAFEFFRVWGDSNGDGEVTNADRTATEDVNGDGRVNSRDRIVYRTERGKKLHDDLFWWLDD